MSTGGEEGLNVSSREVALSANQKIARACNTWFQVEITLEVSYKNKPK